MSYTISSKPITVLCNLNLTNTDYVQLIELIPTITSTNITNGILLLNHGQESVNINNNLVINTNREIQLLANDSIFIPCSTLNEIYVKTNGVQGSLLSIKAN